jgi:hypothetical protein
MLYLTIQQAEPFDTDTFSNPLKALQSNVPLMGDSLFDNVIGYVNDDLNENPHGLTGLDKCIVNCNGKCVEFGLTGNAMCFPK